MRKSVLIVNADDLGYTPGINRGIYECFLNGIVRSASLMANGQAFEEAVSLIRKHPDLDVGIHLTLTELPPVADPADLGKLLKEDGLLPTTPRDLAISLAKGRFDKGIIFRELDAQVSKVLDYGIVPSHFDSHKHVHALPPIFDVVLDLARKYGVTWVRTPFEKFSRQAHYSVSQALRKRRIEQHLKSAVLRFFEPICRKRLREEQIYTVDHFYGIALTGAWDEQSFLCFIRNLPAGLSELMVHPGYCDGSLHEMRTRLGVERERELSMLTAEGLKTLLEKQGIELGGFRDLRPGS